MVRGYVRTRYVLYIQYKVTLRDVLELEILGMSQVDKGATASSDVVVIVVSAAAVALT